MLGRHPARRKSVPGCSYLRRLRCEQLERRDMLALADLDTTWGGTGTVVTAVGSGTSNAVALDALLQPNGQTVVVGVTQATSSSPFSVALVRYNADGSLDTSFGGGGTGEVTGSFSSSDYAQAAALQTNGSIVVGGYATVGGVRELLLARYTSAGVLDTTFGNGRGYVTTPVLNGAEIAGVAIQPNGKIVVDGFATGTTDEFVVARYNTNGTLDTSFGTNSSGIVTTALDGTYSDAFALALESNGEIIAAGRVLTTTGGYEAAFAEYSSSGVLGSTLYEAFGTNSAIDSLAIDPNGNIVFGGYEATTSTSTSSSSTSATTVTSYLVVGRLTANLTLDTSFNSTGFAVGQGTSDDSVDSVSIMPDGRIVGIGSAAGSSASEFEVVVYGPTGILDSDFNSDGYDAFAVDGNVAVSNVGLVDNDGRIMVFGTAAAASGGSDFASARLGDSFNLYGNTVEISGTAGTTNILFVSFTSATTFVASLNGGAAQSYVVGTATGDVSGLTFFGGLNNSTLTYVDPYNTYTFKLSPDTVQTISGGFLLSATDSQDNYIYGNSSDTVDMFDTSGSNQFVATSTYSEQSGSGYFNEAAGVGKVNAYSASGTIDTAYFYSVSNASVTLTPQYTSLVAGGQTAAAWGFPNVLVFGAGDGTDDAYLYGSTGTDTFLGTPTYAYLMGTVGSQSFDNVVESFAHVYAYAGGGTENAYFYDLAGASNTFVSTPTYSYMTGSGYYNEAFGFAGVVGFSSSTSTDTAYLYDQAGAVNTFAGGTMESTLSGTGYANSAYGFANVMVFAGTGSTDSAWILDSAGSNVFDGSGDVGYLSSASSGITVEGFGIVTILDQNGDNDQKTLQSIDYTLQTVGTWT